MKILFTMLIYNDVRKGQGFYSDLVTEVQNLGHEVTVVAPSLDGNVGLRDEGSVSVLRVKTGKLFNVHPVVKGISNLRLPAVFQKALNQHMNESQFDWIVSPTPPITLAPLIKKLKTRFNCPSYLILRDIFPQNARDLGLINNSMIFNVFRRKEKLLYEISDVIGCMSQGNIDYVKKHNRELDPKKLTTLTNWIANPQNESDSDSEKIKEQFGLGGKWVALFGGNLGKPQKIESIVELAGSINQTHPAIQFVLIGDGTERARISSLVAEKNLANVTMLNKLPQEAYLKLAAACDVGLVNLSEKFTIPNIPSRTLAYWACSLPVLACVDAATDLDQIIASVDGGLSSLTGDLKSYRENLLKLYDDPQSRIRMGQNGRQAIREKFDTAIIAKEFVGQLNAFSEQENTVANV